MSNESKQLASAIEVKNFDLVMKLVADAKGRRLQIKQADLPVEGMSIAEWKYYSEVLGIDIV